MARILMTVMMMHGDDDDVAVDDDVAAVVAAVFRRRACDASGRGRPMPERFRECSAQVQTARLFLRSGTLANA